MRFGPPFPIVAVTDFSSLPMTDEQWASVWRICGPSAEKNMTGTTRRGPLELWQVIAAAYIEGLQHGSEMAKPAEQQ